MFIQTESTLFFSVSSAFLNIDAVLSAHTARLFYVLCWVQETRDMAIKDNKTEQNIFGPIPVPAVMMQQ